MADADYTDMGEVERWLREQAANPETWDRVVVFAARCALRVVPTLQTVAPDWGDVSARHLRDIILPVLRATEISWVAAKRPTYYGVALIDAAGAASYAAASAVIDYYVTGTAASAAAASAAAAAGAPADAADSADAAADAAARAADAAARAAFAAGAAIAAVHDIEAMELGVNAAAFAGTALWRNETPNEVPGLWGKLSDALRHAGEDWDVWIDWYEARLRGGPTHPDLSVEANKRIEIARVLEVTEEDWRQGPAHVNAMIKAIIERERERDHELEIEEAAEKIEALLPDEGTEPLSLDDIPEVPKQVPSLIEPEWIEGQLRLPGKGLTSSTSAETRQAALNALAHALSDIAKDCKESGQIDRRFVDYLEALALKVPQADAARDAFFA
ncbi:MAG: hypothetical protein AAF638_13370, partial [Pseudomonadota bacterium]